MNPFASLLDQTEALNAHATALAKLNARVHRRLDRPPVIADPAVAEFDAAVDQAAESTRAWTASTLATVTGRAGSP